MIHVTELEKDTLPFLFRVWHTPEVMQYADEFPRLRGWSKSDTPDVAWQKYQKKRAELGIDYTQLILRLEDGTPMGESFFAPLPEGATFGKWQKLPQMKCLVGDIKLEPTYWGQGLGTQGMRQVVQFAFTRTSCNLFAVPPHVDNPAAYCVYEKAGFVLLPHLEPWRGHRVMELSREKFREIYGEA